MPLTNVGRNFIAAALIGEAVTPFSAASARLGVGDGTQAFSPTQLDLQGTNRLRKGMAAGYPTRQGNSITFKATFSTAEANFTWNEWGVFNSNLTSSDENDFAGVMLVRNVVPIGTKNATQTWELTVTITIEAV
jgi:hypothetical protein